MEYPDGSWDEVHAEKYTYWPPLGKRPKPDWFKSIERQDPLLSSILAEIYLALDNDMPIAAATTMRTAFDRVTQLLKIDQNLKFFQKIDALVTKGEIATLDRDVIKPLVEAGNAAAHRAWTPKSNELTTMILILETLIHRAFILNKEVKALRRSIPKRKKT